MYIRFTNYIFRNIRRTRNFDVEDVQVHVARLLFSRYIMNLKGLLYILILHPQHSFDI